MNRSEQILLFVVNDAGFFLSHRLNIAYAARRAGWRVHVCTPSGPHVERIVSEGFKHHTLPLSRSGVNPLQELRTLAALWRLFRSLRPTLVHAVTIKPVLYSGFLAPTARVPALIQAVSGLGHVFIAEGAMARLRRMLVERAYRFAFRHPRSRVIVQNPDDQKALRASLREEQAVLIPGAGVDTRAYRPSPEPDGLPVIVLASRMLWTKGVADFVTASQMLAQQGVKARFVLVGDTDHGNPAAVPEARLKEWDEHALVEWWGHREDMPDVFAQSAIVCLPSYGEGLPKVLLEAAAAGRPIVASNCAGCRMLVRDQYNGLIVPMRNPRQLADTLSTLLADPTLRKQMGERGRQMVLEQFATEHIERMTLEVYEQLVPAAPLQHPSASARKPGESKSSVPSQANQKPA